MVARSAPSGPNTGLRGGPALKGAACATGGPCRSGRFTMGTGGAPAAGLAAVGLTDAEGFTGWGLATLFGGAFAPAAPFPATVGLADWSRAAGMGGGFADPARFLAAAVAL